MKPVPFNRVDEVCRNKLNFNSTYDLELKLKENFMGKNVIATNSCTAALEMIGLYLRRRFGRGFKFLVPSYTFSSSINAFLRAGGKPVLVDSNLPTANTSLDQYMDPLFFPSQDERVVSTLFHSTFDKM